LLFQLVAGTLSAPPLAPERGIASTSEAKAPQPQGFRIGLRWTF
jgi:hypothetical protein